MNNIKLSKSIVLTLLLLVFILIAAPALAVTGVPTSGILKGVKCAGSGEPFTVKGQTGATYSAAVPCGPCDFIQVFVNGADLIVGLSGVIAILIFIYAGLMYLTVSVKPDNAAKAKSAMVAAIIGLAFIFGGYTIINFVIVTFVGGTEKMNALYEAIGPGSSWGVCEGYDVNSPNNSSNTSGQESEEDVFYKTDQLKADGEVNAQTTCDALCAKKVEEGVPYRTSVSQINVNTYSCSCIYW